MTNPTKLIEEIDALAERATRGAWEADGRDINAFLGRHITGIAEFFNHASISRRDAEDNAAFVSALVNAWPLLRGMVQDAARYRWLRSLDSWPDSEIGHMGMSPEQFDNMCDAALAAQEDK